MREPARQVDRVEGEELLAGATGVAPPEIEEDELRARIRWLKQLHVEDGVPLDHSLAGIADGSGKQRADDAGNLERRFARLLQTEQEGSALLGLEYGSETGPEPAPEHKYGLLPEPEPTKNKR